jgi:hypothetical protein
LTVHLLRWILADRVLKLAHLIGRHTRLMASKRSKFKPVPESKPPFASTAFPTTSNLKRLRFFLLHVELLPIRALCGVFGFLGVPTIFLSAFSPSPLLSSACFCSATRDGGGTDNREKWICTFLVEFDFSFGFFGGLCP